VKWVFLITSVLFNIGAAIQLLDFTYFRWPPPDPIPSIGVVPIATAVLATACGVFSVSIFWRAPGRHRFLAFLPALSVVFALLCLWVIWEYPRAYARFEERQAARLNELAKEVAARAAEKLHQSDKQ
jgi:hypothetical protein